MRARWLFRWVKTGLTCCCILLTFVYITQLLLDTDDTPARVTPGARVPLWNRVSLGPEISKKRVVFKQSADKADEEFKIVFGAKPSHNLTKNNSAVEQSDTSIISGLYKRVFGFSYDVFLFSVVIGNSTKGQAWDIIIMQGWEHRLYENTTFGCCIKYKSGIMLSVNMTKKVHWAYKEHVQMPVKQYLCPNPRHALNDLPELVTISGGTKQTACHKRYNWYLTPYFAYAHKEEIAVCTKLVYGGLSADDILTWFEIHRRMGVNKVLTYTYDLNTNASKVLQYYQSIGMAEFVPFRLPKSSRGRKIVKIGVKNMQAWNDEQIPVYDCLEKLKGYKYLVLMDIDEYIIPNQRKTWMQLFDKLWKVRPQAAGYTFLVHLHITSWGVTNNSSQFTIGRYINRTAAMTDRMKHVTRPDRLATGGLSTHQFTPQWEKKYKRYQAKQDEGTIHHFRACRKDWARKTMNKTCMKLARFKDTSVSSMLAPIEHYIRELKEMILNGG